jgi:hypothetical protein
VAVIPKIRYTASIQDYSGYGEAGRNAIRAFVKAGVEVTVQKTINVREKTDFGNAFKEITELEGRNIDYKIKVIHITPDGFLKHLEPMKYHVAHFFWETSRLPRSWVWNLNLMDEVWTGDKYHAEVFQSSGVKVPIFIYPQAMDVSLGTPKPFVIENKPRFLFYSIFQWIERKNPELLIRAFYEEFDGHKDVGLLLKTYGLDFSPNEMDKVVKNIKRLKLQYARKNPPPILLYDRLMTRDDIYRLHATGDCFVLPHRGEGWGITQAEAALMNKPVISTTLGGVHDWISRKNYQQLDRYKYTPVTGMDFVPWYTSDQQWADPDLDQLKEKMRWVYENYGKAVKQADKLKQEAKEQFSYERVGKMMRERVEQIYKYELIPEHKIIRSKKIGYI